MKAKMKHQINFLLGSSLLAGIAYCEEVPTCANIQDYMDCSSESRAVDVVFVFDTTSSMVEEIAQMQSAVINFGNTINSKGVDYRLGLTEFKDFPTLPCGDPGDSPYTIYNEGVLTANAEEMSEWITSLKATGGYDPPESTLAALTHTVDDQQWRTDSVKIAVVISDTTPHIDGHICNEEGNTLDGVISKLHESGVVTHVIGPEEDSMHRIANETGGSFFEIRSTEDIGSILNEIATLITCTYKQKSEILYKESDHSLNISVKLIGAEGKILPHVEGETKLTTTICREGVPCTDVELSPFTEDEGTHYAKTVNVAAFEDPIELSKVSTFIEGCGRSTTTKSQIHHIGPCKSGVTPKPEAPELSVFVDGLDAGAEWEYATYATDYVFLYAPYPSADPIYSIAMGSQKNIGGTLESGTQLYTGVIGQNCSGYSDYSNIEIVNIE